MKPYLIIILALMVSPAAFAEKTLQECIDTANDLERLVCYDTIFGHSKGADNYSPVKNDNSQSTSNTDTFGKEQIKKDLSKEISEISTRAKGKFKNWTKGMIITLQNGQQWKVTSSRQLVHKITNPKVTIEKGILGAYKLSIEGVNTKLKVKRVK